MKSFKKIFSLILSVMFIVLCFAGCSAAGEAEEISDKTMLIAYTQENAPFIYTDSESGELTGFDVELFEKIFNNIKNENENYKFIQVEEGYKIGEDAAYVDDEGNEYIAYVMIGGVQKNTGSFNQDYTVTQNVIDNRIITVTAADSKIATYADLQGATAGIVTEQAKTAFDKNAAIKNGLKGLNEYADAKTALDALNNGTVDAVIIDEFSFNVLENKDNYKVLDSELDTISYVYALSKGDWYVDSINEAIHELQSPEYNDADEFTPIVEKYFHYDASNFEYNAVNK